MICQALQRVRLTGQHAAVGALLDRLALIHGDRRMVEEEGGGLHLSYREAADRAARLAGGLRESLPAGRRSAVVIHVENGYDVFLLTVAAARAGAVAVPVSAQATEDEVNQVAADCGAALVVRSAGDVLGAPLARAAPARPDDTAAVFYTSGTTGRPKGARLSHAAVTGPWSLGSLYPNFVRRDEIVSGLPVAHIAGFTVVVLAAQLGIPLYLLRHFRPTEALDAIESRRATAFIGVPAMYRMMAEAGADHRDLRSVRVWASGGDTMPSELARFFRRQGAAITLPVLGSLGEAAFVDGYGMVELGGAAALRISLPFVTLPLLPLPGNGFRVVGPDGAAVGVGEVGELAVRSRTVMQDYLDHPADSAAVLQEGWLRTGDLARRGAFGLVTLAGRAKDVIKRGGYSVFAAEVEGALEAHPAVAEAAVVGRPDTRLGEVPVAAVRLRPGGGAGADELARWAAERLAEYKVPAEIRVVDDLPRTGPDKIDKGEVRALFR